MMPRFAAIAGFQLSPASQLRFRRRSSFAERQLRPPSMVFAFRLPVFALLDFRLILLSSFHIIFAFSIDRQLSAAACHAFRFSQYYASEEC
jgi:hypothetical protein